MLLLHAAAAGAKAPPRLRTCTSSFPIGFRIQGKKHARHTNAFLRTQASHYCIAFLQRYGSSERRGPMYIPALRGLGRGFMAAGKREAGAHCVPDGTPAGRLPRRVPAAGPPERAPPSCVYEPVSSPRAPSTASLHKGSCAYKKAGAFAHLLFHIYCAYASVISL